MEEGIKICRGGWGNEQYWAGGEITHTHTHTHTNTRKMYEKLIVMQRRDKYEEIHH